MKGSNLTMPFTTHTRKSIEEMLTSLGLSSIEDLFSSIPEDVKLNRPLELPEGLSEQETTQLMENMLNSNKTLSSYKVSLVGAGVYNHYIPAAVNSIVSLPGFVTPYTPYQPEASQGILTAAFEYQTMVCELTGMEVANASLYDGSTAAAEAVLMALRVGKGERVFLSKGIHPYYREVIKTYLSDRIAVVKELPLSSTGTTADLRNEDLGKGDVVVVQSPNFFGVIEDLDAWAKAAEEKGAIAVHVFTEALSLAVLKSPGEAGFHITAGEGQSFGLPPSFGGPLLGVFATRMKYVRQMPGRVAGETRDAKGRRGFVFTLSTREQHIRRARATSNVCTNVQLNAVAAAVYLSLMGPSLVDLARDNAARAHYLYKKVQEVPGVKPAFDGEFFNEFTVCLPVPAAKARDSLLEMGFLAGVPVVEIDADADDKQLLVAVTEKVAPQSMDEFVTAMKKVCQ